tara:strand:- start:958 stop:2076 length:1119 start_codon:yes stop_codon:yes gene_type:complete
MQFIDLKYQQSRIRDKLERRLKKVLDHGIYIMGPEVFELEATLSKYVSTKHCISCSSGTDAILIPLLAKNIGPGDAVLTTPFTYIATAEVIALVGATPVFVDIYDSTFNIDPDGIKDAVNFATKKGLRPKAIIPVDLFGLPARHRIIKKMAEKHDLIIIDDAAQGFGGQIGESLIGSFGHVTTTSFFPAKPLGCYGDGGAIFTENDEFAEIMKSIRVHGSGANKYENIRVGLNGRMDTVQAAILLEKFSIFKEEVVLRNKVAKYYIDNIHNHLVVPYVPKNYLSSWAQFSILANSEKDRKSYIEKLKEENIPSMIYYSTPLHLQPVFRHLGYSIGDFPVSEKVSKSIFSIPMHPYLKKRDQDKIIQTLNDYR